MQPDQNDEAIAWSPKHRSKSRRLPGRTRRELRTGLRGLNWFAVDTDWETLTQRISKRP